MPSLLAYLQDNEPQFRKARHGALYADFLPQKTLNPDGYEANISAWLSALSTAALLSSNRLTLTINEPLLRDLESNEWGRPLSLGTVVKEGLERQPPVLASLADFESGEYRKRRGWAAPTPWDVLKWGVRMLGLGGSEEGDKVPVTPLVILGNVETASKELARRIEGKRSRTDRIYTKSAFREEYVDVLGKERVLSETDMEVLLRFLSREKGLLVFDGDIVKLKGSGDKSVSPITEQDITIASLKTLIKDLEVQTEILTKRVDELDRTAKEAVTRKNRVAALAALRSKKLAETTLTKRHATLAQVEEVFSKIEQAADQVELVSVMEASTRVLSGFNKEAGGVERVDDVVYQLREQMSQVDEIGNIITEAGQAGVVDETEVDDELEAMEREEREKREAKERAEREEKEKKEVEETRRQLAALDDAAKAGEQVSNKFEKPATEQSIEDTVKQMQGMSLDREPIPETH